MLARCVQVQVVPVANERRMQHHVMYGTGQQNNRGTWGIACGTTLRLRRCEAASKAPRCRARGRRIGREKGPPLLKRPEVRGTGKDPVFARKQEIQLRRAPGLAWQLALRTLALCRLSPEL